MVDSRYFKGIITRKSILKAVNSLLHDFTHLNYIIIPKTTDSTLIFLATKVISEFKAAYMILSSLQLWFQDKIDETTLRKYMKTNSRNGSHPYKKRKRSAVNQFYYISIKKGELAKFSN